MRSGLALLGDYADVLDARLANQVHDGGSVAVFDAGVSVDEDRGASAFLQRLADQGWQRFGLNSLRPEINIAVASDRNYRWFA